MCLSVSPQCVQGHQGNRDSRVLWIKDDNLLTTGFNQVILKFSTCLNIQLKEEKNMIMFDVNVIIHKFIMGLCLQMRQQEVRLWDSRKLSSSLSSLSLATSNA